MAASACSPIKITISGLRSKQSRPMNAMNSAGEGVVEEITIPMELLSEKYVTLHDVWKELQEEYIRPDDWKLSYEPINVKIVRSSEQSCYTSSYATPQLKIRVNESPIEWWAKYTNAYKDESISLKKNDTISVFGSNIRFMRTLRVPDDGIRYHLPPSLGEFPLYPVEKYASKLPPNIRERGGFMTPMYQREALWISFNRQSGQEKEPVAMKVSVGGINAITGLPKNADPVQGVQDYLCASQPWLDGIAVEPGLVRQFTAVDVDEGYTIEEQITGENSETTLQIDVFPVYKTDFQVKLGSFDFYIYDRPERWAVFQGDTLTFQANDRPLVGYCYNTKMADLVVAPGMQLKFQVSSDSRGYGQTLFVKTVIGTTINIGYDSQDTIWDVKLRLEKRIGLAPNEVRLILGGRQLENSGTFAEYAIPNYSTCQLVLRCVGGAGGPTASMGIAAGGRITQKIHQDKTDPRRYAYELGKRVYVHAINAKMWKAITGEDAPITPVSKELYANQGIPWFELYNEPRALKSRHVGAGFTNVKSIASLDEATQALSLKSKKIQTDIEAEKKLGISARWNAQSGNRTGLVVALDADRVSRPSR